MQLIIKNGKIIATHEDHQWVADKYPGCECISWDKDLLPEETDENNLLIGDRDDPRGEAEKKNAYLDKRRVAYPSIEDQLDMIYHDTVDGTTIWRDAIAEVKDTYQKPIILSVK